MPCAALAVLAGAGAAAVSLLWPAARLAGDPHALEQLTLAPVGEHVASVAAVGSDGRRIAVDLRSGRLWPAGKVPQGETVTVKVTVRRAGWIGWLVGGTEHVEAVVRTPEAHVESTILRPRAGGQVAIRFDAPVGAVTFTLHGAAPRQLVFGRGRYVVGTGVRATGGNQFGTLTVSAAPRGWEALSTPVEVSWFPAGARLQALVHPAPGTTIQPTSPITLTFSEPIAGTLGSVRPTVEPATPGTWTQTGVNTLTFRPTGAGFGLGDHVVLTLPLPADIVVSGRPRPFASLSWEVPVGTTLRLQQLLSDLGYLPLVWQPANESVASTAAAQKQAAIDPPAGTFSWRYPDTPAALQALWKPGDWTRMTQAAVMSFESDQGLAVDGVPGPHVWHALIAATLSGSGVAHSYSYVLVHRTVPQNLELWNDGLIVLRTRVNTGVPGAPTPYGTHAVFEHIPVGTMRGRNPDGSRYVDHGIRWISYFNGGEAIHGFDRASYGFPQSVGCVETPIATAAKIWPYTPIGTLVTIEP